MMDCDGERDDACNARSSGCEGLEAEAKARAKLPGSAGVEARMYRFSALSASGNG